MDLLSPNLRNSGLRHNNGSLETQDPREVSLWGSPCPGPASGGLPSHSRGPRDHSGHWRPHVPWPCGAEPSFSSHLQGEKHTLNCFLHWALGYHFSGTVFTTEKREKIGKSQMWAIVLISQMVKLGSERAGRPVSQGGLWLPSRLGLPPSALSVGSLPSSPRLLPGNSPRSLGVCAGCRARSWMADVRNSGIWWTDAQEAFYKCSPNDWTGFGILKLPVYPCAHFHL